MHYIFVMSLAAWRVNLIFRTDGWVFTPPSLSVREPGLRAGLFILPPARAGIRPVPCSDRGLSSIGLVSRLPDFHAALVSFHS